ncbi:MAG TPA: serine hydrolase [Flavobacterium sp.]|nr:serine hydrolase [Flavobacterium sp.]
MTNSKTFLICLLISLTNVITINAQVKATPKPKTSDAVDQLIAKYAKPNEPGIAVSVIKDGAIVYKKGVGIANLEYGIPITTSTVFHVASVSKQFTVFSILLLEQDGKLSLDDDIRKYLPEMPNYGNPITLRNLANHTSGIRDNTDLAYLIGTTENDLFSNEQAVKLITSQKGLNFIPGEEFEYCNSGYILLAEIVKRVSGQSFSEFTETRIFKPLKMKNSVFLDNPEMIVKNKAYSYFKQDTYYKSLLNFSFVGSTGLNTTVEDLSLWALNFENKTIGNNIIFDKMNKKSQLNSGEIINYALGQETKNYKGLDVLFHGGGDAGYRSYLLRIPEHNFSLVILSNSREFIPISLAYEIVDCYLKDKEKTIESDKPKSILDYSVLEKFVGDYEVMNGLIVSITKENDTLFHQMKNDNEKVKLIQTDNFEFTYPNLPNSKIIFDLKKETSVTEFKWLISDFVYKGKRMQLKAFDKTKINLNELAGNYYSSEVNTSYNLIAKENTLVATHSRNDDMSLSILQPDIFIGGGFFGKVEFIRNEQNKVIGMYVSGQKSKRIKFDKN